MNLDRRGGRSTARWSGRSSAATGSILLVTGHHRPGEPPVQRGQDPCCGSRLAGRFAPCARESPRFAARIHATAAAAASTSCSGAGNLIAMHPLLTLLV